jgi:hypothetical protein
MILLVFFGLSTNLKGLFMNIQQHERIARIKKLSRYLYLTLTGIQYLLWVLWPLTLIWLWVGTESVITLFDKSIDSASLNLLQRSLIGIVISVFLLVLMKVTYHLRQLILDFSTGNIFNKNAIGHARKALQYALGTYAIFVGGTLATWIYLYMSHQRFHVTLNGDFIFGLVIFGLMYVLLWALEIGCDLNEESELTI